MSTCKTCKSALCRTESNDIKRAVKKLFCPEESKVKENCDDCLSPECLLLSNCKEAGKVIINKINNTTYLPSNLWTIPEKLSSGNSQFNTEWVRCLDVFKKKYKQPYYTLTFRCDDYPKYSDMEWDIDKMKSFIASCPKYSNTNPSTSAPHDFESFGRIQFVEGLYGKGNKENNWACYNKKESPLRFPHLGRSLKSITPVIPDNNDIRTGEVWPLPLDKKDFSDKPLAAGISKKQKAKGLITPLKKNLTFDEAKEWLDKLERVYAGNYFHVDDIVEAKFDKYGNIHSIDVIGDDIAETIAKLFCNWILAVDALYWP